MTREPNPWTGCRFEEEAKEPEVFLCPAGCGTEVEEEGDYCSDLCEEIAKDEDAGDADYHRERERDL